MLEVLKYPDERLRTKADPVDVVDDDVRRLIDQMAETMYAAPGIGLAANQVGVLKRVAVVDVSYPDGEPDLKVLVNPEIVERHGSVVWEEGCLSFPEIHEDVDRSERVKVAALDREGRPFEIEADGLLAVALQHELDHLDGVLLIDHVSFLKKQMIRRQLVKLRKSG